MYSIPAPRYTMAVTSTTKQKMAPAPSTRLVPPSGSPHAAGEFTVNVYTHEDWSAETDGARLAPAAAHTSFMMAVEGCEGADRHAPPV